MQQDCSSIANLVRQAENGQYSKGTEAEQPEQAGEPDLQPTDLLGSQALGPLGLAGQPEHQELRPIEPIGSPAEGPFGQAGQLGHPDLHSTDLLGSRALGPLGLGLRDSGEMSSQPSEGSRPDLTEAAPQQTGAESMHRQDSESAGLKKKNRSGFGSLFRRKSSPVK